MLVKERSGAFTRLKIVGAPLLRLEKGEIPPPCEGAGASVGMSTRGQNSDINMHTPQEKRDDNDFSSLFCFAPSHARVRAPARSAGFGQSVCTVKILTSHVREKKK